MRPIKFRGKCIHTKQWVYGGIRQFKGGVIIHDQDMDAWDDAIAVDSETVGEYVEKLDAYEGDILKFENYDCDGFWSGAIMYNKEIGRFVISWGKDDLFFEISDFTHEGILGNIHDNPELLTGVE